LEIFNLEKLLPVDNSAIGYVTPKDMREGRQRAIHAARDRNLEAARATPTDSASTTIESATHRRVT
jgi:hypothetical protein